MEAGVREGIICNTLAPCTTLYSLGVSAGGLGLASKSTGAAYVPYMARADNVHG